MPDYALFIRSIRIRYLTGILIFALASGVIIFALNKANTYRHDVDSLGSQIVQLMRDLKAATSFAEQTTSIWSPATSAELGAAARGHAERLTAEIESLTVAMDAIKPRLSQAAAEELGAA